MTAEVVAGQTGGTPRPVRRFSRLGVGGLASSTILLLVALSVFVGPMLWSTDPLTTEGGVRFGSFTLDHPLGTDALGRDILSRVLHGGRLSILGGLLVLLGESVVGLLVGGVAGMLGGRVDALLSRIIDGLIGLPMLVVAFALVGALGASFSNIVIALVVTGWPWYARAYRGLFVMDRGKDYVASARVVGVSFSRLVGRHVLPNIAGPIVVLMSVNFASAILRLTSLSFLGLGVQPPQPEWGAMINEARPYFQNSPWPMIAPGLAIAMTVLAANFLGDSLRDWFDPRYARPGRIDREA